MSSLERGLVSIVMPAYNSADFLAESVRSVVAQTYPCWELLIVDDDSQDSTLSIARQLAKEDSRIRVIASPRNTGVAGARNLGMNAACGQYLAFLDSDDLWIPNKLKTQISYMQLNGAVFSFTQYRRFASDGFLGAPLRIPRQVDYRRLLKGNVIGCLTVMLDRDRIPPFSMPHNGHEDYISWLHILKQGFIAFGIQEDLARYRISTASLSGNKKRSAAWTWNIYRKIERLSLPQSTWYFLNYAARSLYIRSLG